MMVVKRLERDYKIVVLVLICLYVRGEEREKSKLMFKELGGGRYSKFRIRD